MSDAKGPDFNERAVLELLDEMIMQQRDKTLKLARKLYPGLTPDDIMNPFDWAELTQSPQFMWEDGLTAGLESAHAAICARFPFDAADYKVRRLRTGNNGPT